MNDQEGIIKYELIHHDKPIKSTISLDDLTAWRHILFRLELINQIPARYQGYGFGNISERVDDARFIVSGTQTGHLALLQPRHYALIERAEPELNRLISHGCTKPSSEALTHAILYQLGPEINAVIHVHCPEIWRNTKILNIPHTEDDVSYGTTGMVIAVKNLYRNGRLKDTQLFTMLGHEDGVVVFGKSMAEAAILIIKQLSQAIALDLAK